MELENLSRRVGGKKRKKKFSEASKVVETNCFSNVCGSRGFVIEFTKVNGILEIVI